MKASELRDKTLADLRGELETLLKEQFNLRMENGTGQLPQTHRLRQVRRDIARARTVITEKQAGRQAADGSES